MRALGAVWRALRLIENLLTGAVVTLAIVLMRAAGLRCSWAPRVVSWWHRRLCRALALHIEYSGAPDRPGLLVANHISWLDIPVLGARGSIGFLSKDEVRGWPLIGWMSAAAGTLFLKRGAHQSAQTMEQIAAQIRSGVSITVFPEGTTSDGSGLLRFHPRLFAVVQQADVPVQPVAIRYGSNSLPDQVAPFVGDDDLLRHVLRLLGHPGLRVQVAFLAPLPTEGIDRRRLSNAARAAIAQRLGIDPAEQPKARGARRGPGAGAASG
jgi:1-acyl-sn-glycerol-3-phosphate acyltransferase